MPVQRRAGGRTATEPGRASRLQPDPCTGIGTTDTGRARRKPRPSPPRGRRSHRIVDVLPPPTRWERRLARQTLERSGLLEIVAARFTRTRGRPRGLPHSTLIELLAIAGMRPGHRMTLMDVARLASGLPPSEQRRLRLNSVPVNRLYFHLERAFTELVDALTNGWEHTYPDGSRQPVTMAWWCNRMVRAALPRPLADWDVWALDGTDVETYATLTAPIDDADAHHTEADPPADPALPRPRRAAVLGHGPDGRAVYTADPDARAGHRSATGHRTAGKYVGDELHLLVAARPVAWTNGVTAIRLGAPIPGLIGGMNLQPAGTDRTHAAAGLLDTVIAAGGRVRELIADRGYTQYLSYFAELRSRGITSTHRLIAWQRRPTAGPAPGTVILDGQLFSDTVPDADRLLPALGFAATAEQQRRLEQRYAQRAAHRYGRLSAPDQDGYVRFASPFTTGRLRSAAIPASMRAARRAPLLVLGGDPASYSRSVTVAPEALPLAQATVYGTYAHNVAYGRRQAVEATNGVLKERFIRLDRSHIRTLGTAKRAFLLAFSLAGANHWMWDNHCHRVAEAVGEPRRNRRRPLQPAA